MSPYGATPVALLAGVSLALARYDRRRAGLELDLSASVLADPVRGYLTARSAGVTWRHFSEPDAACLWFAAERCRFKALPDVLGYAAKCLQAAGLWDGGPSAVYRGAWRGLRWHWGALAGTALAFRPDPSRVRQLALELLELDARQEAAARGLAYAARVLAGTSEKGVSDGNGNSKTADRTAAGRGSVRLQRPAGREVA